MTRLLVHVEGETEETFVREVLAPYLCQLGYAEVSARLLGNSRQRDRRGGITAWAVVRREIERHLKRDTDAIATTMVDYYGLPQVSERAWPGRADAASLPFVKRASHVQNAILQDLTNVMGTNFNRCRFIPFVIMHEFEGLLFSDCHAFSLGINRPELEAEFITIREQFQTPEEINDRQEYAPSKRVLSLVPNYEKPLFGTLAVLEIGLYAIRNQCPNFKDWLGKLEQAVSP